MWVKEAGVYSNKNDTSMSEINDANPWLVRDKGCTLTAQAGDTLALCCLTVFSMGYLAGRVGSGVGAWELGVHPDPPPTACILLSQYPGLPCTLTPQSGDHPGTLLPHCLFLGVLGGTVGIRDVCLGALPIPTLPPPLCAVGYVELVHGMVADTLDPTLER